jgi:uncharacterized integral membrane protein
MDRGDHAGRVRVHPAEHPRRGISFLWLHGTLPLAVGLLIATVAGIVVTMVLGTARITQLRRLARRRRD